MANATLNESVQAALDHVKANPPSVDENSSQVVEPAKVDTPVTTATEDKPAGWKTSLNDVEQTQAFQLFESLRDPEKSPAIVKFLAEQSGLYTQGEKQTPTEKKETTNFVLDALKEGLGSEFDFLADKLGPAIEKIIGHKVAEGTKDIQAKVELVESEKLEKEASTVLTNLAKEHFNADDFPKEVSEEFHSLMKKIQPYDGQTTKEYLENLFHIAAGRLGIASKKENTDTAKKNQKLEANRNNAAQRVAASPAAPEAVKAVKQMNLKESIQAAIDAVRN